MTRSLLCFGDSNTHGTPPMENMSSQGRFGPDVRWPSVMQTKLAPGWTVIEEGHPGRTTVHDDPIGGMHKNGIRMLPALLETHRPINVIVIMLGTNDLGSYENEAETFEYMRQFHEVRVLWGLSLQWQR